MSKKKSSSKKDDTKAGAAVDDATFDSVEDEPPASGPDDNDKASAEPVSDESPAREAAIDSSPRKKGAGFVAWLALIAAFVALAGIGFDLYRDRMVADQSQEDDAAIAGVASAVRALRDSVASLEQNMDAFSERLAERDRRIADIGRRLDDRLQQIESLGGRVSSIEGSVASLQGISSGARDAWLLAEAEYYMQIANAQLQLAGNPELAGLALGLADERILQLANPALTGVRRALSDELRALEMMETPDIAGVTLELASLADSVDGLPLDQEIVRPDDDGPAVDPELSGTDRALESLKNAFSNVVSVRRTDETVRPLIAPEAQYFLRANLALQLQAARLAVLRGEESIFQQSLDDASAWLAEYYDTDSAAVQSALETIRDLRGSVFALEVPDISGSLRLLRQFTALEDAREAPVREAEDEPAAEPEQ